MVLAAGCLHTMPAEPVWGDPGLELGQTHRPYAGRPAYLASNAPLYAEARPLVTDTCRLRSAGCDARLRAQLAALDGQLLALSEPPTETQQKALALTVQNLEPLLQPYPDLMVQHHELTERVCELATVPVSRQRELRRRLIELSDLLRVQLAASK
jgi:hypothetical protein